MPGERRAPTTILPLLELLRDRWRAQAQRANRRGSFARAELMNRVADQLTVVLELQRVTGADAPPLSPWLREVLGEIAAAIAGEQGDKMPSASEAE